MGEMEDLMEDVIRPPDENNLMQMGRQLDISSQQHTPPRDDEPDPEVRPTKETTLRRLARYTAEASSSEECSWKESDTDCHFSGSADTSGGSEPSDTESPTSSTTHSDHCC